MNSLKPYSIKFCGHKIRKGAHIFRGRVIYQSKTDVGKAVLIVDRDGPSVNLSLATSADDFLFARHIDGLQQDSFTVQPKDHESKYGMFVIELFAAASPESDVIGTCLGQHPVGTRASETHVDRAPVRKRAIKPRGFSASRRRQPAKV